MHIAMNAIHSTQLDLNLLKTFDALFVTRSTSRAAQALGVGQPAVSHALGGCATRLAIRFSSVPPGAWSRQRGPSVWPSRYARR